MRGGPKEGGNWARETLTALHKVDCSFLSFVRFRLFSRRCLLPSSGGINDSGGGGGGGRRLITAQLFRVTAGRSAAASSTPLAKAKTSPQVRTGIALLTESE